jgi:hypothetical protein
MTIEFWLRSACRPRTQPKRIPKKPRAEPQTEGRVIGRPEVASLWSRGPIRQGVSQSSSRRPGILRKSAVLCVTKVKS